MKKIIKFLCVSLILVICVSGCQSANPNTKAAETTEVTGEFVAELVFWDLIWGEATAYVPAAEKLTEQFNSEHPNIHVTYESIPWEGFYEKLLTSVQGNAAPDIATPGGGQPELFSKMGRILPLDSIIEDYKAEGLYNDFVPGSVEYNYYNGMQVSIPFLADPRCYTYNKAIFRELGIEKLPQTYDELLAILRLIKENSSYIPLLIPANGYAATEYIEETLFNNGIGLFDEKYYPTLEDPKAIEALNFIKTLFDEELVPAGSALNPDNDVFAEFAEGNTAIVWGIIQIAPDLELGVIEPVNGPSSDVKRALYWNQPICAFNQTKYPEETKIFIKWWLDNSLLLWQEGQMLELPARISFTEDPSFSDEYFQELARLLPYNTAPTWPAKFFPEYQVINNEGIPCFITQEIIQGSDIQSIVKKYGDMIHDRFESQGLYD